MTLSALAGPPAARGAETYAEHVRRLGALPAGRPALLDELERSRLRGRGGAGFPVATKWRSVAARARGNAVVLANGAEGEPLSRKDRTLMALRPHLVLDGAILAASAVGAAEIVLYVGEEHGRARLEIERALRERSDVGRRFRVSLLAAPARYVSGEESAAVHFANSGVALPNFVPPRPFEKGVRGRPTLVQNVESLAHAALVARHGGDWFRALGRRGSAGTVLLTLAGGVRRPGVVEAASGTTVAEAIELAGGPSAAVRAVLLGGYFGTWVDGPQALDLPLDAALLRERGATLGCGIVAVLGEDGCGPCETAAVMDYLAGESAAQCGPCFFGLRALAEATGRIAAAGAGAGDLERLRRWAETVRGRGACRHPDGAAGFLQSALTVFDAEFAAHRPHRRHVA